MPPGSLDVETGPLWECPQLLHVDGRDVLLVSVNRATAGPDELAHTVWFVGDVVDRRFVATASGLVDEGDVLYAPTLHRDESGRPLLIGWLREVVPAAVSGADHAGALSLPRAIGVVDGRLVTHPVDEVAGLRSDRRRPDRDGVVALQRPQAELRLGAPRAPGGATVVELRDADGALAARLTIDDGAGTARLDVTDVQEQPRRFRPLPVDHTVAVGMHLDATILEVFVSGRSWTTRLPAPPRSITAIGDGLDALAVHAVQDGVLGVEGV